MFFFEGSEKKTEVIINTEVLPSLLLLPQSFWHDLVSQCGAKILSSVSNAECAAYLLSESSLLIWKNKLLIVTCGTCQLVNALTFFIEQVGLPAITHVSYQRKNEYFSHAQPSCFGDDAAKLNDMIKGKAYCFGELDSHHSYLFHQENNYRFASQDKSYEWVAYQISEQATHFLTQTTLKRTDLRAFFQISTWLPDFVIDDHCFAPYGYSLNAIKGGQYLTLHVTPQAHSSYISIESNMNLFVYMPMLLEKLQPKSIDIFTRNEDEVIALTKQYLPNNFVAQTQVTEHLENNAQMFFANYIVPPLNASRASVIDINNNEHAL